MAQEEADSVDDAGSDDLWLLTDADPDPLFEPGSDHAPEELAMHVVRT